MTSSSLETDDDDDNKTSNKEESEDDDMSSEVEGNCDDMSSRSICRSNTFKDVVNNAKIKTVTAVISNGCIIQEGDYFHTATDESGRLVYTPNPKKNNSKKLTPFLPLISNIVQLTNNGDYYIKCRSQPTDEDITAIFGPDCLVQVIKVDAVSSYYHASGLDFTNANDLRYQQSSSSASADSTYLTLPAQTLSAVNCLPAADTSTSFSVPSEVEEKIKLMQANYESELRRQTEIFQEERQNMQKQIISLQGKNQTYHLQAQQYEEEHVQLQERIKEIESKLHQTSDTLMKEIDFISTKVLLLQNELMKSCAEKVALKGEIAKLNTRLNQQCCSHNEKLQSSILTSEVGSSFCNSDDRQPSAITQSDTPSLTDAKSSSNPNNRWNHHVAAFSSQRWKVVQLFHHSTSAEAVQPEQNQQQLCTASTIRRLSKTSFPEVFHKNKLSTDSSTTVCDNEYDIQYEDEEEEPHKSKGDTGTKIPNPEDVSSLPATCGNRPRRSTLFRRTL